MDYVINFWALCAISAHLNVIALALARASASETLVTREYRVPRDVSIKMQLSLCAIMARRRRV